MAQPFDLSGLWHSEYQYQNKLEPGGNLSIHDVKIYGSGNQLVLQSIPNEEDSYLIARLTFDDNLKILTGTIEEQASPTGLYKSRIYFGAGMLKMADDGNSFTGKITMYNDDMQIISRDWELTRTKE